MLSAEQIIQDLDGLTALARALDLPVTTVSSWKQSNSIPRWRHPDIIKLAKRKGFGWASADLPVKRRGHPAPVQPTEQGRAQA